MEKGALGLCWWELVQPCEKQYGVSSKKLSIELPREPEIPLLDISPPNLRNYNFCVEFTNANTLFVKVNVPLCFIICLLTEKFTHHLLKNNLFYFCPG